MSRSISPLRDAPRRSALSGATALYLAGKAHVSRAVVEAGRVETSALQNGIAIMDPRFFNGCWVERGVGIEGGEEVKSRAAHAPCLGLGASPNPTLATRVRLEVKSSYLPV